jgi:outer membrane protein TolC
LARLRQIDEELALLAQQESLGDKAQERLSRLAFRTSEQEAAAQTFRWNRQALAISRQQLEAERDELRLELAGALGTRPSRWDFTVPHRESWPSLPSLDRSSAPELKALKWEVLAAEEALKKADAGAWPGLSLGPVLENESGPGNESISVGGALSLELPLWDRNNAERSAARAQRELSARLLGQREQSFQQRLDALQIRYQAASAIVAQNAHALEDGAPKLKNINNAYLAGRLPVATALEAFRQYFDAIEKNHALEREALSSLWRFHALMGVPMETLP